MKKKKEEKVTRVPDEIVDTDEQKVKDLTEMCQRIQADFENYKKRVEEEKKQTALYFKKEIITHLLPTLDMFELALRHKEDKEEFIKGMEMIYAQFFTTLENEGLKAISSDGAFNPELHEAIMTEDSDEKDGTILEELQRGYTLDNQVIRYVRVKVAKRHKGDKK